MKLGSVTKLDKKKKTTSKNWRFSIFGQFEELRKQDCGRLVYKTYIFIKNNLLSYKNWKLENL